MSLPSSFLAHLAEKIATHSETPLENTIVVVPNKRARRELLRKLATHFSKPVFAPNILSVNEFMESLSVLKKIDGDELLLRLFDLYKKKNPEKNDDFSAFLAWAPLFLNDINEIDLHLADAPVVFTNLSEIKTLETSFGKEQLTEAQRVYLKFYNQLAELYLEFTAALRAEGIGYEGMVYREVFQHIGHGEHRDGKLLGTPFGKNISRYIFAGINAATPSELEVLNYYRLHKNAEFYFDVDIFYDEKYGTFVEEIRQKLRISELPKSNHYREIPKQITCIGAPKRTAQIYQAIELLNKIELEQGNLNDTVLVLADETLLLPFVHAYNTEKANITMGYPLRATFVAQQLLQLIDDEKQNNRQQKPVYHLKTQGFEFLQHLIITLQKFENEQINMLLAEIFAFLENFFAKTEKLDFVVVEYFLKEKLNAATIPFTGNAHEGLQIMGLLETRMLDFKNVIVLSLNEGVLPKGKAAPSMLLYDIRRHFGLPTHQRKDAVFGYHFFRLLQRAQNIFLIYDNESTSTLAEKSRFIEQLAFEIKKQQLQEIVHFTNLQYVPPFSFPVNDATISIVKTEPILKKLVDFEYSPTSLKAYIQCPLQFYWKFIEKITVPERFDQTHESAVIGTVIHKILEEIFAALQENSAQFAVILSSFEENMDDVLTRVFQTQPEIENEDITQGKLFLFYQIVKKSILDYIKVIQQEWEISPFQIIATEIPLVADIEVDNYKLRLKGTADRIEMRHNKVTVLDYKTGKVDAKKLQCKVEDFETIFAKPEYSQLFQLLCYACLYQNNPQQKLVQTTEIQCGIIAFQELFKQNEAYIYYAEINKDHVLTLPVLHRFEIHLKQLFSALLDEKTAFCQTNDVENCKYCDYKTICNL
ncbi:MAG: PD-(D/E)XK nuclease family protein [Lentimicrobiaceae bacterium]|nr:PD-(D/E)XK nuclease family protein [Lentimicrobiaceae bacterium]